MVTDNDAVARTTKAGWDGFCKFLTLSTGAIVIALGLMAIFLL